MRPDPDRTVLPASVGRALVVEAGDPAVLTTAGATTSPDVEDPPVEVEDSPSSGEDTPPVDGVTGVWAWAVGDAVVVEDRPSLPREHTWSVLERTAWLMAAVEWARSSPRLRVVDDGGWLPRDAFPDRTWDVPPVDEE